jgi:hypothetical protein
VFGGLEIISYFIGYTAEHCAQLNPLAFGCIPPVTGGGGIGGMAAAPEPATLVLLVFGILIVWGVSRSRRRVSA